MLTFCNELKSGVLNSLKNGENFCQPQFAIWRRKNCPKSPVGRNNFGPCILERYPPLLHHAIKHDNLTKTASPCAKGLQKFKKKKIVNVIENCVEQFKFKVNTRRSSIIVYEVEMHKTRIWLLC